ncbi:MAG: MCE family protein [Paludibacteraceae bacterium]|nr:MCE family protein [Paludibacteraceae bacterium]
MKKYSREIVVGILAIIALFLLYFGWNFLKGVNIFTSTYSYVGKFENINGLTEQAPVYVRGYKVGQVDKISYDFTQVDGFTVILSVKKDVLLVDGTQLALVSQGVLGGEALQLNIPTGIAEVKYHEGDTLPTIVVPGLLESLQAGLLEDVDQAVRKVDSLVTQVNSQLEGDHIKNSLAKVDKITTDLSASSADLKKVIKEDVPVIVGDAKIAMADVKKLTENVKDVDLKATVAKVDSTMDNVKGVVASINSKEGTLGLLINDKALYVNINDAVENADSLLVDLKAHPKRYVHFSLFGKKDKKEK